MAARMPWLPDWLRGGSDELGWDDLIRRVTEAIAPLAAYAARGQVIFPAEVVVRITTDEGRVGLVREFLEKPEFDREVDAALANRFDCATSELPTRDYVVSAADRTTIAAGEGAPKVWEIEINGGDLAGTTLALPSGRSEIRFGRGEWHGPDHHIRNDLVVCQNTEFVSRRAGRLTPAGHQLEVESLDQGDALLVQCSGGAALRPARTARGRLPLRAGDVIELVDGRGNAVRLLLRRKSA
jgi:hypothetical protein